jgi:hypothetical protein
MDQCVVCSDRIVGETLAVRSSESAYRKVVLQTGRSGAAAAGRAGAASRSAAAVTLTSAAGSGKGSTVLVYSKKALGVYATAPGAKKVSWCPLHSLSYSCIHNTTWCGRVCETCVRDAHSQCAGLEACVALAASIAYNCACA